MGREAREEEATDALEEADDDLLIVRPWRRVPVLYPSDERPNIARYLAI